MGYMLSLVACSIGRTHEVAHLFRSLELQTEKAFEVILVDQNLDGRLDSIVDQYRGSLSLRRIFSKPGLSRARNEGLKHVKGDVIAFPDDDCIYPPLLIADIGELFRENVDGVTVMSRDETGAPSGPNWLSRPGRVLKPTIWRQAISYTIFIRYKCFAQIDGFDPDLGVGADSPWQASEETDFLLRLIGRGAKLVFEPRLHVVHPQGGGTLSERRRKTYSYGLGLGYVVQSHNYSLWFRIKLLAGPLLRCSAALMANQRDEACLHWEVFSGRKAGLLGSWRKGYSPPAPELRASIIINNFNHAQFLPEAVESALNQTHPNMEVIVVDDGSTDDSLAILEKYSSRITLIVKRNAGQASCYSTGFLRSSGDVVMFLDADDYLRPECIERALEHWAVTTSKVHFYLTLVDAAGVSIGANVPSGRLAEKEALEMMDSFGVYCSPPASGNLFSASFLKKILPLKNEAELIHSADSALILAAPYFGQIIAIPRTLGFYRRHAGANTNTESQIDASLLSRLEAEHKRDLLRDRSWRMAARQFETAPFHLLDPSKAKRRLCYLRLSGGKGLVAGDTRWSLLSRSVRGVWLWSGYTFIQRILATGWFALVASLPMFWIARLIKMALVFRERKEWQQWVLTPSSLRSKYRVKQKEIRA